MKASRLPAASIQSPRAAVWATVMGGSTSTASVGPWISVCASGDQCGRSPLGNGSPVAGSSPETLTSYRSEPCPDDIPKDYLTLSRGRPGTGSEQVSL